MCRGLHGARSRSLSVLTLSVYLSTCQAVGRLRSQFKLISSRDELCEPFSSVKAAGYDSCNAAAAVNICDVHPKFCAGQLHLRRCELPQVPAQAVDPQSFAQWVRVAAGENITIAEEYLEVSEFSNFRPSQESINLCRVCSITWDIERCFVNGQPPSDEQCESSSQQSPGCLCAWKEGISVADSGYIIDGHHHWAAVKLTLESSDTVTLSGLARIWRYSGNGTGYKLAPAQVIAVADKYPDLIEHSSCEDPNFDKLLQLPHHEQVMSSA